MGFLGGGGKTSAGSTKEVNHEQLLALLERRANERQDKGVQDIATNGEPFSALQERQAADIRTKPVQRQGAGFEQLVTSPLQQERIQTVQNLPVLSPARQQAVQDSRQWAAQPLYQALRPQLEALQQIQDPAQRRMTEAALERPFYLLWQEAVRRQTGPVVTIPSPHSSATLPFGGSFLLSFRIFRSPVRHSFCKKDTGGEKPIPPFCYRNAADGAQPR